MRALKISLSVASAGLLAAVAPPAAEAGPDVDRLCTNLTSEDETTAREAEQELEGMGAEIVPVLFDKLLTADWTLRPRLLEVLSAHGREFAKENLLSGDESERIYAALVYELTRAGEPDDHDTREFEAMVDALLEAIKSDDKYLRAAAGLALVYDDEDGGTVFFEKLHEIVPALISSFDTDLVIRRRSRGDISEVVFMGTCGRLDAYIGDHPVYYDVEQVLWAGVAPAGEAPAAMQRTMRRVLSAKAAEIGAMKAEWQSWWTAHSALGDIEIAKLMIERDLDLFAGSTTAGKRCPNVVVASMLKKWTGVYLPTRDEAVRWWEKKKDSYRGPLHFGRVRP